AEATPLQVTAVALRNVWTTLLVRGKGVDPGPKTLIYPLRRREIRNRLLQMVRRLGTERKGIEDASPGHAREQGYDPGSFIFQNHEVLTQGPLVTSNQHVCCDIKTSERPLLRSLNALSAPEDW